MIEDWVLLVLGIVLIGLLLNGLVYVVFGLGEVD